MLSLMLLVRARFSVTLPLHILYWPGTDQVKLPIATACPVPFPGCRSVTSAVPPAAASAHVLDEATILAESAPKARLRPEPPTKEMA